MWVAPSPLKISVPEQGLLQMSLHSYWSREGLGMGKRKGWMYNLHPFRHWSPKVLCLCSCAALPWATFWCQDQPILCSCAVSWDNVWYFLILATVQWVRMIRHSLTIPESPVAWNHTWNSCCLDHGLPWRVPELPDKNYGQNGNTLTKVNHFVIL